MRRGILILAVSILVNAALGYGVFRMKRLASPAPASSASETRSGPSKKPVFGSKTPGVSAAADVGETTNAPAFHWSQLESEDFKEYIARLRAFGVPEKVIRDIIMAEINALYRPKFAALRPAPSNLQTNYWKRNPFAFAYRLTAQQREETKRLQKEQRELVKALFGENIYAEMAKESGNHYVDPLERIIGSENQALLEQVQGIRERLQDAEQDIYAKAGGYIDQWTQEDLQKLRKASREEITKLLSPEQIEQYELRNSDTAQQLRHNLGPFEPSEEEFKALFRHKQAQELTQRRDTDDDGNYVPPSPEETAARAKTAKESEEALKTALGEDRLKEFKLYEDYGTRQLAEAGVPKENLYKLGDVKKEAETAARKIQSDRQLTPQQRKEALAAIYAETMTELNGLLGERYTKAYRGNGGYWLQNIKPPE